MQQATEATQEKVVRCFGFTRITCEPCPSTEDIQSIKYDSLGTIEKKPFCATCRSYLLDGPPHAWEGD